MLYSCVVHMKVVASLDAGMPQEVSSTDNVDEATSQPPPSSVEDVAFSPSLPLALTASLSGAVGVWDIATQKLRHKLHHQVNLCVCIIVCVYANYAPALQVSTCIEHLVIIHTSKQASIIRNAT